MTIQSDLIDLLANPKHTRWIAPLLIVADAALCGLIIWKVPYTEIDWRAYMDQIRTYIAGERDYAKIHGSTGPLVYPGAHVYIYRVLYSLTDSGRDVAMAQLLFAIFYLFTLTIVMACYRMAKAPPYLFPLLVMSKRLHSIFLLRCFNDCFAVGFLFCGILAYQKRFWTVGSMFLSLAVGVKMTAILAMPAVAIVLLLALGKERASTQYMLMTQLQILFGFSFLKANTMTYMSRAFNLRRVFLYKWTVNWRFVPEEVFLSPPFAVTLLVTHASILALFLQTRWTEPAGMSLKNTLRILGMSSEVKLPVGLQHRISGAVTSGFILETVLTSMIIGLLCARSLHYQFFAYISWAVPLLLWRAGCHPISIYTLCAAQEWAWNVYPSTRESSAVVVAALGITVALIWARGSPPKEDKKAMAEIDRAVKSEGVKQDD